MTAKTTTRTILTELKLLGLTIELHGENLQVKGVKSKLTPELLNRLKQHKSKIIELLSEQHESADFMLTDMQQAYLVGRDSSLPIGGVSSHVYHEIEGNWNIEKLSAALNMVLKKHPALRTKFTNSFSQYTVHEQTLDIKIIKANRQTDYEKNILQTREQMSHQIMDAVTGPLLDVRINQDEQRMTLHVSHDGLVMDGLSMFIFFRDWSDFYSSDEDCEHVLNISFKEYVTALKDHETSFFYEKSKAFWFKQLEALPPPPQLPLKIKPDTLESPKFVQRLITLSPQQWRRFKKIAKDQQLTETTALAAVYAELISIWSSGQDLSLAMTLANRLPIHPDIDQVIGNFSSWMLHGDMGEDNRMYLVTDEEGIAKAKADGEWIESGAHLMLFPADPSTLNGQTTDFNSGAPYVMFSGTEYAHLMIPVEGYYDYQAKK